LLEFQQWIGKGIPTEEDEEYDKPFSNNPNTLRWRRWKERKSKTDYEQILKDMKGRAKESQ